MNSVTRVGEHKKRLLAGALFWVFPTQCTERLSQVFVVGITRAISDADGNNA